MAGHAFIDGGPLELIVKDAPNAPGDMLIVDADFGSIRITTHEGYRAPLLWLQERKSEITDARFVAVPLFQTGVLLGFDAENRQVVWVQSGKPPVDALLALLATGVAVKADAIAEQVFPDADQASSKVAAWLLRDKFLDPYAAAVAGYFMVRFNKFDLLRDWSRNLADYFPYMSDGCIIEGWRRLIVRGAGANPPWPQWRLNNPPPASPLNPQPNTERSNDPIADAAQRFLEAHARGLPTFHYGLEKHLEGLMFCFDRTEDPALKEKLEGAIDDISSAAQRAYSSAGLTTIASIS
jgi:hypothetical protein